MRCATESVVTTPTSAIAQYPLITIDVGTIVFDHCSLFISRIGMLLALPSKNTTLLKRRMCLGIATRLIILPVPALYVPSSIGLSGGGSVSRGQTSTQVESAKTGTFAASFAGRFEKSLGAPTP